MRVGITDYCTEEFMNEPYFMKEITFNGEKEKSVNPGEFFCTDIMRLAPQSGEYIYLEIAFSGNKIPYHEESIITSFVLKDGKWKSSKFHPFASMIGCDRGVKGRIAFLGDSITQGIGTEFNSYAHWNSIFADNIGTDYAYWNLGLGFGRAEDAASNGAWLFKAKQNDIIIVCYGVNDILMGYTEDEIKHSLNVIVNKLKDNGRKVIIQTIPPFNYEGEKIDMWKHLNNYIKDEISKKTEFVFDCTKLLGKSDMAPHIAQYGGHPNANGCKIWGDALSEMFKRYYTSDKCK